MPYNDNSPDPTIEQLKMLGPRILLRAKELMETEKLLFQEAFDKAKAEILHG